MDGTTLLVGESATLTPQFTPADASNQTVSWETSNASLVSVTQDGRVTGVDSGDATITIRSQDGSNLTASAIVRVIQPNPTFTAPGTVDLGTYFTLDADMQSSVTDPIVGYSWKLDTTASTGGILVNSQSGDSIEYRATKQGVVVLKVVVTTQLGRTYESAPQSVTINPVTLKLPDRIIISVNDTKDLFTSLSSGPVYGKGNIRDFLVWHSNKPGVVSIDNSTGAIVALKEGTSKITVQSIHDSTIYTETEIIVKRKFDDSKGKY
ncbi:Bacterial Ig-like domain (group 2) [compost metagenome]